MEAKPARLWAFPEPAKSPSWTVLAVWGTLMAAANGVPGPDGSFVGALAGAFPGARAGAATRTGVRGGGVVLVGHRRVVVFVVLVVLGGTAMAVVVGAGIVDCVTCREDVFQGCAFDTGVPEATICVGSDDVEPTESIPTTAVAVTRGAATTLVAGWRTIPRLSRRTACRGGENRIRLITAASCERVSQ